MVHIVRVGVAGREVGDLNELVEDEDEGVGRGCEAQHGLLHGLLASPYDYFVALFKECSPFIVARCC